MDTETLLWIVASGAATGVGGLALLLVPRPSDLLLDVLLGFTAGIMLAATAFSLLVPALDEGTLAEVLAGVATGGIALLALDALVPHVHLRYVERGQANVAAGRRALLLLSALTIHNVPEGMAVGVAFAAGGPELGVPIALAIGIQNVPEGFAAAAPLLAVGTSRRSPAPSSRPPRCSPSRRSAWPALFFPSVSPLQPERCSTSSSTSSCPRATHEATNVPRLSLS